MVGVRADGIQWRIPLRAARHQYVIAFSEQRVGASRVRGDRREVKGQCFRLPIGGDHEVASLFDVLLEPYMSGRGPRQHHVQQAPGVDFAFFLGNFLYRSATDSFSPHRALPHRGTYQPMISKA